MSIGNDGKLCGSCHYFAPAGESDGECRRKPPAFMPVPVTSLAPARDVFPFAIRYLPIAPNYPACGEYIPGENSGE